MRTSILVLATVAYASALAGCATTGGSTREVAAPSPRDLGGRVA